MEEIMIELDETGIYRCYVIINDTKYLLENNANEVDVIEKNIRKSLPELQNYINKEIKKITRKEKIKKLNEIK